MKYIVLNKEHNLHVGDLVYVDGKTLAVSIVANEKIYLRKLTTFEWIALHYKKIMKKIGL